MVVKRFMLSSVNCLSHKVVSDETKCKPGDYLMGDNHSNAHRLTPVCDISTPISRDPSSPHGRSAKNRAWQNCEKCMACRHETLKQCCGNVGPVSQTVGQLYNSTRFVSLVMSLNSHITFDNNHPLHIVLQIMQKAVTAYVSGEQLLPYGFARQYMWNSRMSM